MSTRQKVSQRADEIQALEADRAKREEEVRRIEILREHLRAAQRRGDTHTTISVVNLRVLLDAIERRQQHEEEPG